MEAEITLDSHPWILDPSDHFGPVPNDRLILVLGPFVPDWVSAYDNEFHIAADNGDTPPTPHEWFNLVYAHGGGWSPFGAGKWRVLSRNDGTLQYGNPAVDPEDSDPPMHAIAKARMGDYDFFWYEHALCALFDDNGNFQVARMD